MSLFIWKIIKIIEVTKVFVLQVLLQKEPSKGGSTTILFLFKTTQLFIHTHFQTSLHEKMTLCSFTRNVYYKRFTFMLFLSTFHMNRFACFKLCPNANLHPVTTKTYFIIHFKNNFEMKWNLKIKTNQLLNCQICFLWYCIPFIKFDNTFFLYCSKLYNWISWIHFFILKLLKQVQKNSNICKPLFFN